MVKALSNDKGINAYYAALLLKGVSLRDVELNPELLDLLPAYQRKYIETYLHFRQKTQEERTKQWVEYCKEEGVHGYEKEIKK